MYNWKKKIGKHIFIHYFITFLGLGKHSNVNNVINVLLCLCSCFYVHLFVVNYFLRFSGIFLLDRGVGGWGVSLPNFFGFLYLQGPQAESLFYLKFWHNYNFL